MKKLEIPREDALTLNFALLAQPLKIKMIPDILTDICLYWI